MRMVAAVLTEKSRPAGRHGLGKADRSQIDVLVGRTEDDVRPHQILDSAASDPADPRFVYLRTQRRPPQGQRAVHVDIAISEAAGGVDEPWPWRPADTGARRAVPLGFAVGDGRWRWDKLEDACVDQSG